VSPKSLPPPLDSPREVLGVENAFAGLDHLVLGKLLLHILQAHGCGDEGFKDHTGNRPGNRPGNNNGRSGGGERKLHFRDSHGPRSATAAAGEVSPFSCRWAAAWAEAQTSTQVPAAAEGVDLGGCSLTWGARPPAPSPPLTPTRRGCQRSLCLRPGAPAVPSFPSPQPALVALAAARHLRAALDLLKVTHGADHGVTQRAGGLLHQAKEVCGALHVGLS